MILVDSSAWITYLRNSDSSVGNTVATLNEYMVVCTAGIILQEVLQGIKAQERYLEIREWFDALPFYEARKDTFRHAAHIYRTLRKSGVTVPSSDALIAATAIENNLTLYTLDLHFNSISAHFDLHFFKPGFRK